MHKEVLDNLESIQGALLRMNRSIQAEGTFGIGVMRIYIVEVTQTGYKEVEAEDCNSAEEIADNLNACEGVQ